jgi:hypothetical protein
MGSTYLTSLYLTRLAEVQAKLGHCDEAWQMIFEAIEEMEKGGEVQHQAEINRVAGEIALSKSTAPSNVKLSKTKGRLRPAIESGLSRRPKCR